MTDTSGIIGAGVGILALKVTADLVGKGMKASKKGGKVSFKKIKW